MFIHINEQALIMARAQTALQPSYEAASLLVKQFRASNRHACKLMHCRWVQFGTYAPKAMLLYVGKRAFNNIIAASHQCRR